MLFVERPQLPSRQCRGHICTRPVQAGVIKPVLRLIQLGIPVRPGQVKDRNDPVTRSERLRKYLVAIQIANPRHDEVSELEIVHRAGLLEFLHQIGVTRYQFATLCAAMFRHGIDNGLHSPDGLIPARQRKHATTVVLGITSDHALIHGWSKDFAAQHPNVQVVHTHRNRGKTVEPRQDPSARA